MTARRLPALTVAAFAAGGLTGVFIHWHNARRLVREAS